MRFESAFSGRFVKPKVIAVVIAVTGLLYGLEGFFNDSLGRPDTGDRVLVVVIALFAAHIVWTLGRMRRPVVAEPQEELQAEPHEEGANSEA